MSGIGLTLASGRYVQAGQGQGAAFLPTDVSAVKGWLRLQASAQAAGEWTDWVDVMQTNPGAINSARRPAVGASANGLPIASFVTNDAVAVPLSAGINNQTATLGWGLWARVGNLAGFNTLLSISTGTNGASVAKIQLFLSSTEAPTIDVYDGTGNGRRFAATTGITQNTWAWIRVRFNGALGGDANGTVFVNGVLAAGTYSSLGLGAMPNALPSPTGKLIIGNINDGAASAALTGDIGPNIFFLGGDITAAEETRLMAFEAPT